MFDILLSNQPDAYASNLNQCKMINFENLHEIENISSKIVLLLL